MIDTTRLRALYEADRDEAPCPECGEPAFQSDCWQVEALDQAPDMLDEIDALREAVKAIAAVNPGGFWRLDKAIEAALELTQIASQDD